MSTNGDPFQVLVAEDEYFIADDLERALRKGGFSTLGPVAATDAGLDMLRRLRVDYAIIDLNLEGSISFALAVELQNRSIPFLFLTGYDTSAVPTEFQDVMLLQKPHGGESVVAHINRCRGAPGPARPTRACAS